jgi:hypothetical protein
MATSVIVHGGWGGGWEWTPVARRLRERGHDVFTPTLTGVGERAHLGSGTGLRMVAVAKQRHEPLAAQAPVDRQRGKERTGLPVPGDTVQADAVPLQHQPSESAQPVHHRPVDRGMTRI